MKKKILSIILLAFLSTNIFAKQYVYKYHYKPSFTNDLFGKCPDILSVLERTLNSLIDKNYKIISVSIKSDSRVDDGFIIVYEDKE